MHRCNETRYVPAVTRGNTVIMVNSLQWKGVQFARQQLNIGLQIFSNINAGDFDLAAERFLW